MREFEFFLVEYEDQVYVGLFGVNDGDLSSIHHIAKILDTDTRKLRVTLEKEFGAIRNYNFINRIFFEDIEKAAKAIDWLNSLLMIKELKRAGD